MSRFGPMIKKNPLLNYYYYLFPGLSNGGFFSFLESSLWAAYLRLHTENILGVCRAVVDNDTMTRVREMAEWLKALLLQRL